MDLRCQCQLQVLMGVFLLTWSAFICFFQVSEILWGKYFSKPQMIAQASVGQSQETSSHLVIGYWQDQNMEYGLNSNYKIWRRQRIHGCTSSSVFGLLDSTFLPTATQHVYCEQKGYLQRQTPALQIQCNITRYTPLEKIGQSNFFYSNAIGTTDIFGKKKFMIWCHLLGCRLTRLAGQGGGLFST